MGIWNFFRTSTWLTLSGLHHFLRRFRIPRVHPSRVHRTPASTVKSLSRKFRIFIRTILGNFYPDGGSGLRHVQFLSGRDLPRGWRNVESVPTLPIFFSGRRGTPSPPA